VQTRAGDRDRPPRVGLRLGRKGEGGPLVDLESERELQTGADALVLPDPLAAIALLGAAGARPGDLLTVLMTNRQRLLEVPVVFLGADGSQAPAAEPDAGREQEKMERIVTELLHPLPAGTRAIGACGPWFVALGEGGRILRAASFGMGDGWGAGLVFEPRR
jgi:hypothetical protein